LLFSIALCGQVMASVLAGQMMTGTINAINKKTGVFGITYSQQ